MDPLQTSPQTIHLVDHTELERFAREAYALQDYSFNAIQEGNNHAPDCWPDADHCFAVTGELDGAEDDVALIRSGEVPLWRNDVLLNMLCQDGLIPPGNYLIQCQW